MNNEDFEREHLKDQMYLAEKQNEIEQEYYEWEEQERKPATIKLKIRKKDEALGRD